MYSKNNTAKEYILKDIAEISTKNSNVSVLDFACGTCLIWKNFFIKNKFIDFTGFDFNNQSIKIARKNFPRYRNKLLILDGQKKLPFNNKYDIITTFSSLEHVRNKFAFLKNIKELLKKDGVAYINYDNGHFKGGFLSKLIHIVSEILALIGITEKFYTKRVSLSEIKQILDKLNFKIIEIKFFNIQQLKMLHKAIDSPELLKKWYDYEIQLNTCGNKDLLEKNFLSVVIKVVNNE